MAEVPDYSNMPSAAVRRRAAAGDKGAQDALSGSQGQLRTFADGLAELTRNPFAEMAARDAEHRNPLADVSRQIGEAKRMKERAAVAREEAMIEELSAMRVAIQRSDEREAKAVERADAAEVREREARIRSDRRESFLVKVSVFSAIGGAVGAIAAVVALVLT